MARKQKKPREGDVWMRTLDSAKVTVLTVRVQRVSYVNNTTKRRGSATVLGFMQRFEPAQVVWRMRVPSRKAGNVVDINTARRVVAPVRRTSGGGFMSTM